MLFGALYTVNAKFSIIFGSYLRTMYTKHTHFKEQNYT